MLATRRQPAASRCGTAARACGGHYPGAGARQSHGHGAAQATAGAGHDGDAACQPLVGHAGHLFKACICGAA